MHLKTISMGLRVIFVGMSLLLAFQGKVQADSSSSGDERMLGGWLEREIDWRPLGLHTYWKGGFHIDSPEEKLKVKIGGSIMLDGGIIKPDNELNRAFPRLKGEDVILRRARLNVLTTFYDVVDVRLDIDFANVREIKDNWIGLKRAMPILGFSKVGHMKEPFSLEELTSGTDMTFMEGSLPALAFSPGRNMGLLFSNTAFHERMTWAAGTFWNTGSLSNVREATDSVSNANGYNFSARVTGLPWDEEGGRNLLHVGLSYSHGVRSRKDEGVRFRAVPESYLKDDKLVDTGELFTGRVDRINMEGALVRGPFSLQGEYFQAFTDAKQGSGSRFWGFYLQGSYFLTGEHRPYHNANAVFSKIRPIRDFHPFRGGWGAWELGARLSHVDLSDGNTRGGRETNLTLGLNWYLDPHLKLAFNYIRGHVEDRAKPPIDDGPANIFQGRFQVTF
jgi:phosphate-selective porin OprO and OprP